MITKVFKSSAREKIQITLLTLLWMMSGLYFLIQAHSFFAYPWLWAMVLTLGLVVSFRQWNQVQLTLILNQKEIIWKTFSRTYKLPYQNLLSVQEDFDRNRLFLSLRDGSCYKLGMGDRNYKKLLETLYEKVPLLKVNLTIPRRVRVSIRYLVTYFLVFFLPSISGIYFVWVSPSFFRLVICCSLIIFMLSSVWSLMGGIPIIYEFRNDSLSLFFFPRRKVVVPYKNIERVITALDKHGFWHSTIMMEDSSFWEISEVYMSKSLYLYFLYLAQQSNVLRNA